MLWVQWGNHGGRLFSWWRLKSRPRLELGNRGGFNGNCYCPHGRETWVSVELLGFFLHVFIQRDWTPKPCWCDKVVWSYCPDSYPEEIEEYGADKLKAECPWMECSPA